MKNPVTMRGRIERCWLFTHSIAPETARGLLPERLQPILHNDRAFTNIVVCELCRMRPKGAPGWLGMRYRHAALRVYAQFTTRDGERIGGLYFVRSDANSKLIAGLGNALTDFRFRHTPILIEESESKVRVEVQAADAPGFAEIDRHAEPTLHPNSSFTCLTEAEAFLKYEPAGISVQSDGRINVVRIRRREEDWLSRLVQVANQSWGYLPSGAVPEVCYELDPIDYEWSRAALFP